MVAVDNKKSLEQFTTNGMIIQKMQLTSSKNNIIEGVNNNDKPNMYRQTMNTAKAPRNRSDNRQLNS